MATSPYMPGVKLPGAQVTNKTAAEWAASDGEIAKLIQQRNQVAKMFGPSTVAKIDAMIAQRVTTLNSKQDGMRNADGSWKQPEFVTLVDPATGKLSSQYQLGNSWKDVALNTTALESLRKDAMRDAGTQSAWAKAVSGELDIKKNQQMDQLSAQQRGLQQSAYDDLANNGGLSTGARERVARGGIRDHLVGSQGINQDFNQQAFGLQAQDEQNRISQLNQVQGFDFQKGQFDQTERNNRLEAEKFDISNTLNEIDSGRSAAWKSYEANQAAWAADKAANAQQAAGKRKKLCFLTTAMCEHYGLPDDCDQLTTMRQWRDSFMQSRSFLRRDVQAYYELADVADPILRATKDSAFWDEMKTKIDATVEMIKSGKMWKAYRTYKRLIKFATDSMEAK